MNLAKRNKEYEEKPNQPHLFYGTSGFEILRDNNVQFAHFGQGTTHGRLPPMKRLALTLALMAVAVSTWAQQRIQDVIYMKSGGAAFSMDVFKPKTPNGAAVIFLVSGGWVSSHEGINTDFGKGFNDQGYTVFQVVHGAQPKYNITEIFLQITRAVRFIRSNATTYGVDANRMALCGASAGGHLSLLVSGYANDGDPKATDPIDKVSSRVAAIGVYFPPTDFLHFGSYGQFPDSTPKYSVFRPAFGFAPNETPEKITSIYKALSPITTVTAKFPPTLLIYGDKDDLVPLQQGEVMRDALTKADVRNELLVIKGGAHDGVTISGGAPRLVSWFNQWLLKK